MNIMKAVTPVMEVEEHLTSLLITKNNLQSHLYNLGGLGLHHGEHERQKSQTMTHQPNLPSAQEEVEVVKGLCRRVLVGVLMFGILRQGEACYSIRLKVHLQNTKQPKERLSPSLLFFFSLDGKA
jgi:hypothetical protein